MCVCYYLLELQQMDVDIKLGKGKGILYPEHLGMAAIQRGIKEGQYRQGTFLASRENYREGFVSVPGEEKMVRTFCSIAFIGRGTGDKLSSELYGILLR